MVTDACRRGRGSGTGPAIGATSVAVVDSGGTEPVAAGSASAAVLAVVVMDGPSDGAVDSVRADAGLSGSGSAVEGEAADGSDGVSALKGGGAAGGTTSTVGGAAATLTELGARGSRVNERMNQVTAARQARTSAITIVPDSNRRKTLRSKRGLRSISMPTPPCDPAGRELPGEVSALRRITSSMRSGIPVLPSWIERAPAELVRRLEPYTAI
jgi:hypothetical protein